MTSTPSGKTPGEFPSRLRDANAHRRGLEVVRLLLGSDPPASPAPPAAEAQAPSNEAPGRVAGRRARAEELAAAVIELRAAITRETLA